VLTKYLQNVSTIYRKLSSLKSPMTLRARDFFCMPWAARPLFT